MFQLTIIALTAAVTLLAPSPALAQRWTFERTFDVAAPALLDVRTARGRVEVIAGEADRIVITGTVTLRTAWDVPANADVLARRVVADPPVARAGDTIRLRTPAADDERRAVTVSYQIRVPAGTEG